MNTKIQLFSFVLFLLLNFNANAVIGPMNSYSSSLDSSVIEEKGVYKSFVPGQDIEFRCHQDKQTLMVHRSLKLFGPRVGNIKEALKLFLDDKRVGMARQW